MFDRAVVHSTQALMTLMMHDGEQKINNPCSSDHPGFTRGAANRNPTWRAARMWVMCKACVGECMWSLVALPFRENRSHGQHGSLCVPESWLCSL